jgi:hypothetical protein
MSNLFGGGEKKMARVIAGEEQTIMSTTVDFNQKAVQPDQVNVVLYHAGCPDGFAAALAAWKRRGPKAKYVGVVHGKEPPYHIIEGSYVAIVDFAYDYPTTKKLMKMARGLIVIDHHLSAQDGLLKVPAANKIFEMRQSGATLAWNYFHPGKYPLRRK